MYRRVITGYMKETFNFWIMTFCVLMVGLISGTAVRGQEIREDEHQVQPLQFLTSESFLKKAQIGIGVAVALNPELEGIKKFSGLTELSLDEGIKATDFHVSV